jgi:hypothetical protein
MSGPPISTASSLYPGHELCEDDPLGTVLRNHAPGFVGTNAQRLAYKTTGLRTSKTWYETDTGLTYQWSGSAWGLILTAASIAKIQTMFELPNVVLIGKCLYGGVGVAITLSGMLATVTQASHGYNTGDVVVISGATGQTGVNALWVITNTGINTYTFVTSLTGSVTGSPVSMFWFNGALALNPTKISNIVHFSIGSYTFTLANTQTSAFYGVLASSANVFNLSGAPTVTAFVTYFAGMDQTQYFCVQLIGIT